MAQSVAIQILAMVSHAIQIHDIDMFPPSLHPTMLRSCKLETRNWKLEVGKETLVVLPKIFSLANVDVGSALPNKMASSFSISSAPKKHLLVRFVGKQQGK